MRNRGGRWIGVALALAVGVAGLAGCREGAGSPPVAADVVASPGVTDATIDVGFVVMDFSSLEATLGVPISGRGDVEAQVEALVSAVNRNGGIAGRRIQPVTYRLEALQSSAEAEQAMCDFFGARERVFAVVMEGSFHDNLRPCLAERKVLMLDAALFPVTDDDRTALAPYYVSPALPVYDDLLGPWVATLAERGFLDGDARLGVLALGTLENKRLYARLLPPALRQAGYDDVVTEFVDVADATTLQTSLAAIAQRFQAAGVNRLISVGGSRLIASLLQYGARDIGWTPRLAVTGYDNPEFLAQSSPDALVDALALSLHPTRDLDPNGPADAVNTAAEECYGYYEAGGVTFTKRSESTVALHYCDAVRLLVETLGDTDAPTAQAVSDGLADLDGFELASTWSTSFEGGRTGGAGGYRVMAWSDECRCLRLDGDETVPFTGG